MMHLIEMWQLHYIHLVKFTLEIVFFPLSTQKPKKLLTLLSIFHSRINKLYLRIVIKSVTYLIIQIFEHLLYGLIRRTTWCHSHYRLH